MSPNMDRFTDERPRDFRDLEREQEIESELADRWHDEAVDREADEREWER